MTNSKLAQSLSLFPTAAFLCLAACAPASAPPEVGATITKGSPATLDYRRTRASGAMVATASSPPPGIPNAPTAPTPVQPGPAHEKLDWRVDFNSAVATTPAVFIQNWPSASDTDDRVWAVAQLEDSSFVLRAYTNLYKPDNQPPDLCFDTVIDSDTANGAIALSAIGDVAYVVTSNGTLYASSNRACDGMTYAADWSLSLGAGTAHTSPWIDYGTNLLYVGDSAGMLHAVDLGTHAESAGYPVSLTESAIAATPVVAMGKVWVGDTAGQLHIFDTTALTDSPVSLCAGSCTADDALYSSVFADTTNNVVAIGANGRMVQVPATCSTEDCPLTTVALDSTNGAIWSAPSTDADGQYVYIGFDNRVFKIAYPLTATSTVSASATTGIHAGDPTYPRSSPMIFGTKGYIGDGGGYVNRFSIDSTSVMPNVEAATPDYGDSVDTTPVIDFRTDGNLYFGTVGTTNGSSGGSLIQITRSF